MTDKCTLRLTEAEDVTDEILALAVEIADSFYGDDRIDWQDVWDRMENGTLEDGHTLDLGATLDSPAQVKIKNHVRAVRRADP